MSRLVVPMQQTIYVLPDGEIIWPGSLFNPHQQGSPGQQNHGNGNGSKQGSSHGFGSMLYALSVLHQGLDDYSEELREAAGKFVEAASRDLADRYGDGEADEVKILDSRGNAIAIGGRFV